MWHVNDVIWTRWFGLVSNTSFMCIRCADNFLRTTQLSIYPNAMFTVYSNADWMRHRKDQYWRHVRPDTECTRIALNIYRIDAQHSLTLFAVGILSYSKQDTGEYDVIIIFVRFKLQRKIKWWVSQCFAAIVVNIFCLKFANQTNDTRRYGGRKREREAICLQIIIHSNDFIYPWINFKFHQFIQPC